MGTDPSTVIGLAIGFVFSSFGICGVVVLCREALRSATEFEGEVKGLSFSLKFRARREIPAPREGEGMTIERDMSARID
jgi:hypothetical protein